MSISVVIPAYRAPTLSAVLDALEPQARAAGCEVIVIESSGAEAAQRLREDRPWVRVLAPAEPTLPGRARNLAAGVASGELLAFLDADAIPEAGWLDTLAGALVPGIDAVAGAVVNGTPRSPVGTAGYLLEFSEWLPGPIRKLRHAATCNLLLRRTELERRGGFAEDVWPGEDTILTFALAEDAALAFAPDARVRHVNRTELREFLRHQRRLGAAFAEVCDRVPFPHRSLVRPVLAPLMGPFRLAALARRLASRPREAALALAVMPLLFAGALGWSVGLARRAADLRSGRTA